MKITVLIENTGESPLIHEHGLSFYIEYQDHIYLLDTGSTSAFMKNAEILGISLDHIQTSILSHGHYDHSGGFYDYLIKYPLMQVYAMNNIFEEHYSTSGNSLHNIGVSDQLYLLKERFIFIEQVTQINQDVYLIPHIMNKKKVYDHQLYVKRNQQLIYDDFSHELSLVFHTNKGLVVLNSCSHSGIVHIIEDIETLFPHQRIYAYIGGLHLKRKREKQEICALSSPELFELSTYLKHHVQFLFSGHCTGEIALKHLENDMGNHFLRLTTGQIIEL